MREEVIFLKGRATQADESTPRVTVQIPDSFGEAEEVWGSEVAHRIFDAAVRDALQRFARGKFEGEVPVEAIQSALEGWVPGTRSPRTSKPKVSRVVSTLAKLSPEEKAELRAKLQEDSRFADLV